MGMHQGVNPLHAPIVDRYLNDLSAAVSKVRESGSKIKFDEHSY